MKERTIIDFAENNDIVALQTALAKEVDINLIDGNRTALHAACVSNAVEAAYFLIHNGCNVNIRDSITGATPLHYCATYNYFEIATEILENKGKVDIVDNYGNEPLWTAVFNVKGKVERLPLVAKLLNYGANKEHKNNAGRSPLDFAKQVGFKPLLETLEVS